MASRIVFVLCSAIGYLIGHFFGQGVVAVYASIMISYHLYLAFLVFTAEKKAGFSLPFVQTVLTHIACVGMVVLLAMGRDFIPFFGIIRLFIPAMAPFEADWLFSGGRKKPATASATEAAPELVVPETPWKPTFGQDATTATAVVPAAVVPAAAPAPQIAVAAAQPAAKPAAPPPAAVQASSSTSTSGEEYEEFLSHLRGGKRPFRKPGVTLKQEFDLWCQDRARRRPAQQETAQSA